MAEKRSPPDPGWPSWPLPGGGLGTEEPCQASRKKKASATFERLEDGRYFYSACMEAFEAPAETPRPPQGHKPEQPKASS